MLYGLIVQCQQAYSSRNRETFPIQIEIKSKNKQINKSTNEQILQSL